MFSGLIARLTAPTPIEATDVQLALGALLVRVAKSDRHYDAAEIARIDKILSGHFSMNVVDAMKLRARCEQMEASAPDTEDFARLIKDLIPHAEREAIVREVWEVVVADGIERAQETCLFEATAGTLGVNAAQLRQNAP